MQQRQLSAPARKDIKRVVHLAHLTRTERDAFPSAICSFLDSAATGTARATFYNTKQEQRRAIDLVHWDLFTTDRGLYAAALLLPGVTDYTRQLGVVRLLSTPRCGPAILSEQQEKTVVQRVCTELPTHRMLNLFQQLAAAKVNNARTRKLILRTILTSDKLEFWAVKYRRKLAIALKHAWGKRTASIVRSILAKPQRNRNAKERSILNKWIGRALDENADRGCVEECVRFVLGVEDNLTLPRLRSFHEAKRDFSKGHLLPYDVLEGIRSRFHKNRNSATVLSLAKNQLTVGQQMTMQR